MEGIMGGLTMKKVYLVAVMIFSLLAVPVFGATTETLLSAVTTTGASAARAVEDSTAKTIYILAASVTSGGTVTIDASPDGTNWVTLNTTTVTANGVTEVAIVGLVNKYIRVNLSARTDGTYTVYMVTQ